MAAPRFRLTRAKGFPVDDAALLDDLRRVAAELGEPTVGQKRYRRLGSFDDTTISKRFGTWNGALTRAGLETTSVAALTDEQLFQNLLVVWIGLGRQPRRSELARPPSRVSESPYKRRFGSWTSALEAFIAYANATEDSTEPPVGETTKRRTGRDPSLRLRFRVMQRDRFRCCQCGATPAHDPGVLLHVDHVTAWSNGGETTEDNLQTLCDRCNLGKSNL